MFNAVKRATFLYPSGPAKDPNRKHLCILLTDPVGPPEQILTVTVVTAGDNFDSACVLNAGDHEFIKHKSYVAYATCRIDFASRIKECVASGEFSGREMLKEEVFKRVIEGLAKSKSVKPFVRQFLQDSNRR